ncbi:MAG: hypothetical protein SH817_08410 [Leptospira sp.]|nr:hypothetical protein [Leptospira sp.]
MKGEKVTLQSIQDAKSNLYGIRSDGNLKRETSGDRDKEVRRLAELYLSIFDCEPEHLLPPNDFPSEIDASNHEHGFGITPEEVAELMKFINFQNETKAKIIDQKRRRDAAIFTKLSEVPYRDWLAGMIYAGYNNFTVKMSVEYADKMIKELYPIEGEIDEDSGN